jgi:hypothetical protein
MAAKPAVLLEAVYKTAAADPNPIMIVKYNIVTAYSRS